ncbi:MAG: hypothetical protein Q4D21_02860 [Phascolarctobacterium sp.]|nr:hypothetical protein [Phascolarctobacterium sp.]
MRNRGSISLSILIGSLFLAAIAQMILIFAVRSKANILEELEDYQLRKIVGSVAEGLSYETLTDGQENWPEITLEPGHHKTNVVRTTTSSDDGLIRYTTVEASTDNEHTFAMRKLRFDMPASWQECVKDYAIIYKTSFEGEEFLNSGVLYTSTKEEVMPSVKFLSGKVISSTTSDEAAQFGFSSRFYYLPSNTFTFKASSRFYGSTVFVNSQTINIASNCTFYDRILLVSGAGDVIIGKNVNIKNGIIVAHGTISIDSGSKINGLIIGNKIVLKGQVQLSRDEEIVTPFSSAYFFNTSS